MIRGVTAVLFAAMLTTVAAPAALANDAHHEGWHVVDKTTVPATVGPLSFDVRVAPSIDPGVRLLLPPAGLVTFATHRAPVTVDAAISEVDLEKARALINSPQQLRGLETAAPDELRTATMEALIVVVT